MRYQPIVLAFCFLLLTGHTSFVFAQHAAYDPDASFFEAQGMAHAGNYEGARDILKRILSDFPEYSDVENLLAQTYSWEGDYDQARRHFNRITSRDRTAADAWVGAVKNEWYAGNTSLALGMANKAMSYLETSDEIDQIRTSILEGNTASESLQEEGRDPENTKHFIGLENAMEVFDQTFEPMVYGSLEYQYHGSFGKLIPRMNYSHRFQTHGVQFEMDAYPKLSKTFYAYLNYGYSNAPTYPEHRVGAELFANVNGGHEISGGARYLGFEQQKATLITGSYGRYWGNYYLSFRPYMSLFPDRSPGYSASLMGRRYLSNKYHYLEVQGHYGIATELTQLRAGTQLLAESLLFVETQQVQLAYQFTGKRSDRRYKAHLGVTRQEFALQPGSFFIQVRAGIRYELGI